MPDNDFIRKAKGQEVDTTGFKNLVKQFPYRPTLFLGLGGTGCAAVAKIKELYLTLCSGEEFNGKIPPMYSFLGIDSDATGKPALLTVSEWIHIAINNLDEFYAAAENNPLFSSWIHKNFPASAMTAGCSGYRNLGRMALIRNIDTIYQRLITINHAITAAQHGKVTQGKPIIFLLSSVSGGTGSGTFLDMAFLLRKVFPSCEIVSLLGVLDGVSSMTTAKRDDLLVNTFAALKELNAFMSGQDKGTTIKYPVGDITVAVNRPFDECHLVSSTNQREGRSLNTQQAFASFLARMVFMMTAYCFQNSGTPDYNGVMVNQRDRFTIKAQNSPCYYVVPGMGQAHFPVKDTADLLAIEATIDYLTNQSGGKVPDDNESNAHFFIAANNLSSISLQNFIMKDPQSPEGVSLGIEDWRGIVEPMFASSDLRYANCADILELGDQIVVKRSKEIKERLYPNLENIKKSVQGNIQSSISRLLASDEALLTGAFDFLLKLQISIVAEKTEINKLTKQSEIKDALSQWQQIRSNLEDVCTKADGMFKAPFDHFSDTLKAPKAMEMFIGHLIHIDQILIDQAVLELCSDALEMISSEIKLLIDKLSDLKTNIENACGILGNWRSNFTKSLDSDSSDTVFDICSYNVMTKEWRAAVKADMSELRPKGVLQNLLKSGWHPKEMLGLKVPKGKTIAEVLADEVYDQVAPMTDSIRNMSPVEVIARTGAVEAGNTPQDVIMYLYNRLNIPQMQISRQVSVLFKSIETQIFCGGIDDNMRKVLQENAGLQNAALHVSNNHETHRINFFNVNLPISLAGCDMVNQMHQLQYNKWREDIENNRHQKQDDKLNELRKFHCFPGSHKWLSPTYHESGNDEILIIFSKALAISEVFPMLKSDIDKTPATIKSKKYGICYPSDRNNHLYIISFFTPGLKKTEKDDAFEGPKIVQTCLGSTIKEAYDTFKDDKKFIDSATKWVNWFERNYSESDFDLSTSQVNNLTTDFINKLDKRYEHNQSDDVAELLFKMRRYLEGSFTR